MHRLWVYGWIEGVYRDGPGVVVHERLQGEQVLSFLPLPTTQRRKSPSYSLAADSRTAVCDYSMCEMSSPILPSRREPLCR